MGVGVGGSEVFIQGLTASRAIRAYRIQGGLVTKTLLCVCEREGGGGREREGARKGEGQTTVILSFLTTVQWIEEAKCI